MGLDFLDAPELSRELVAAYAEEVSDPQLQGLLPFHLTYRALVRGKVDHGSESEL